MPLIGYVSPFDPVRESARSEGIKQRLRELGYVEGQNIAIEFRYREGNSDRNAEFLAELLRLKVDVILVTGDLSIQAAKKATKTIPIVMMGAGSDPVEAGHVESLARLGGEVKEILPVAARALKLTIQPWEVRSADDFDRVFASMSKQRPDGLDVPASGAIINANLKRIAGLALKNRLPSMYYSSLAAEAGGLVSYGADLADSYRQVAWYVDKILKGAKPADLPVQQPMKFEFVINKKTADQIGLTIPQWTLMQATKVIR